MRRSRVKPKRRDTRQQSQGGPRYSPNQRLPLAQERVRRFIYGPPRVKAGKRDFRPLFRFVVRKAMRPITNYGPKGLVRQVRGSVFAAAHQINPLRILQIADPRRMAFCIRRAVRRQVLFAKMIAGRAGGSPGPYHRTQESDWRC